MGKLSLTLSCVWLLLALPALAGDFLIVPGQRIGSVSLGMTRADVHRTFHAPRFTRRLPGAVVEDSWVSPYPDASEGHDPPWEFYFVSVYFRHDRAVQVEVNSPRFKTQHDLSTKSPAAAFERRYRPFTSSDHKGQEPLLYLNPDPGGIPGGKHFVTIEDAVRDGIAWRYGAWGDLAPDPDPDSQEIVIVHARGMKTIREPDAGLRFVVNSQDQETYLRRQKSALLTQASDSRTDVNARDKDGRTLLMQAVSLDDAEAVRRLLARHADVNARDGQSEPVLMQTNDDLIPLLLAAGADVNVQNKDGATPLIYAARTGPPATMRLLLAHGADPNMNDDGDDTALIGAAGDTNGGAVGVLLLLKYGANVNAADNQGRTALMAAASLGAGFSAVKALLAHGANPNAQDGQGRTALMDTVSSYPSAVGTDIGPLLVAHGADVSLKDRHGDTALTLAEGTNFNNARMVRFLKNKTTASGQ